MKLPRTLLGAASLAQIVGSFAHAAAFFAKTSAGIDRFGLPAMYAGGFKLLWLADSSTMFVLAILFGWLALQPRAASTGLVMTLALIPAGTAALVYNFLGGFYAGHLNAATAVAVFISSLMLLPRHPSNAALRQS